MRQPTVHQPSSSIGWRLADWLVIGVGVVVHLGFLFQGFRPKGLTVMAVVLPALVVLPFVLLGVCGVMARGRARAPQVTRLVALFYGLFAAWAYWDTLYVHPDPQGGLIFLVMPVLGVLGALALLLGLAVTKPLPR